MIKRILSLMVCIILLITASGCNPDGNSGESTPRNTSAVSNGKPQTSPGDDPEATLKEAFQKYIDAWSSNDFKSMYSLIGNAAREAITEEKFISRYTGIYKNIKADKLNITATYPDTIKADDVGRVMVDYTASMETAAGVISFTGTAKFRQEELEGNKQWRLLWETAMIFPGMEDSDQVKILATPARRGEIFDRNGLPLAVEGLAAEVGMIPKNLGETAEESKKAVSELTGISVEVINKKLTASYVKPDMFIPIKVISKNETELSAKLGEIKGVTIRDKKLRTYPLGEKAAHLTGYMQQINADELEKLKGEGYTAQDMLGKTGLEKVYQKDFKPEDGKEIYIEDKHGNKKQILASKEPKQPSDLKLAIDARIQSAIYDQLKEDKGAGVAINPKTGEVLALVSTPAFDPNSFILGMTSSQWNALNDRDRKSVV